MNFARALSSSDFYLSLKINDNLEAVLRLYGLPASTNFNFSQEIFFEKRNYFFSGFFEKTIDLVAREACIYLR